MRLVVDGYGKYLGKRDNQIVVKDHKHELDFFLAEELSQVIITGKGSVGFDALKLLALNNVDVVVLNWTGDVIYRLSPPELKNVESRREQFKAYYDNRSGFLCKEFIGAKIENQKAVLGTIAKSREGNKKELVSEIQYHRDKISDYLGRLESLENLPVDEIRGHIFGLEGKSSIEYWTAISSVIDPELDFQSRSGRGAPDGVNAMLNYGYAILRGEIWRAVHLSALDPYAGFLHADRWGRPSLVFDLIEEFRQQIVDKTVFTIINRKEVTKKDFTQDNEQCHIEDKARKKLISSILRKLDKEIMIKGEKTRWSSIIIQQAQLLAKYLAGKAEYKGFYLRW